MPEADTRLGRVTHWTFEPLQVVPVLLLAALYARRVQTLRGRGTAPPGWRICLFALGIVLLLVALASPIDYYVDSSFGVHMRMPPLKKHACSSACTESCRNAAS